MKLLSLIIPTYNMEALLPRCLDSLLVPETLERLEVMVVNDGSKDGSLAVANRYKERFPQTVTVIDKPNGNYGSTINAALPVAQGKYVKVLDSDDWFDTTALVEFLDKLEAVEADMVITHFSILHDDGSREVTKYNVYGREPYDYGKVYALDDVLKDGYIRFFLMHALTYRTALLRDFGYRQTEGISYTDTEWACYPVFYAKDIVFFDINEPPGREIVRLLRLSQADELSERGAQHGVPCGVWIAEGTMGRGLCATSKRPRGWDAGAKRHEGSDPDERPLSDGRAGVRGTYVLCSSQRGGTADVYLWQKLHDVAA